MTWWQWFKSGATALAQFGVWFATDGLGFIAEATLNIMSATDLIEDAAKSVKTCSNRAVRSVANMSRVEVEAALNTFCAWFPEEAPKLQEHRSAIIEAMLSDCAPAIDSPLLQLEFAPSGLAKDLERAVVSPCEEAIAVVVVDVILFVMGLLGLHAPDQERMERTIIQEFGGDVLNGLAKEVKAFHEADGKIEKAKALFSLLGSIKKAGAFTAVWKELKHEMTWWQWFKSGATALAQFGLWFTTDGVAFIAEATLNIMSATDLIEAAAKSVKTCSNRAVRSVASMSRVEV